MGGKFGIVVNIPTEPSQLFASEHKVLKKITVVAGEGTAIKRGTILAKRSDGKYGVLDLDTDVAAEVVAAGTGAAVTFAKQLSAGKIRPGSATIKATIGAAAVNVVDDGNGAFRKATAPTVNGSIDYKSGYVNVTYGTAPDNSTNVTMDFSSGGAANKASAVLAVDETLDTTADAPATCALLGALNDADLVWTANITAAQKARAIEDLRGLGIVLI